MGFRIRGTIFPFSLFSPLGREIIKRRNASPSNDPENEFTQDGDTAHSAAASNLLLITTITVAKSPQNYTILGLKNFPKDFQLLKLFM